MTRLRSFLGLVAALGAVFSMVNPVQAAETSSGYVSKIELAHGLIVKYHAGIDPIANDGSPTGANSVRTELLAGYGLGKDLFTVDFEEDVYYSEALRFAAQLRQDPRVEFVNVNRIIGRTSLDAKSFTLRTAITPATAPQSLVVTDAWNKDLPRIPRVQLSWKAPKSLFGAKVANYVIELSADSGKTWTRLNGSASTSYLMSSGIIAGTKYSYRVRALTKITKITKVNGISKAVITTQLGAVSSVKTLSATTTPSAPSLNPIDSSVAGSLVISWKQQSLAERGGLSVNYTATAKADGQADSFCQSQGLSCTISGLNPNASYKVTLVASNSRGDAASDLQSNNVPTKIEPMFASQWYLNATQGINVPKAWTYTKGTPNVVVAVIDSGITKHPDLDSQIVAGYDFVSNGTRSCSNSNSGDGDGWDADPSDPGDYYSDRTGFHASSWHGTHVAGIIAAAQNDFGISGIAPNVKIQPIRALGPDGGCSSDLIAALNWAAGLTVPNVPINKTPAKVINLSMGTSNASSCDYAPGALSSTGGALAAIKKLGVTTITASGNSNTDANDSYPGNCFPTINVGATGISQDRAWYSNYTVQTNTEGAGVGVDISAPGGDDRDSATAPAGTKGKILSDLNDGVREPGNPTFGYEEGTSMAAPVVSGVVALLYSIKPTITFDQVYEVLKNSVTKFKPGGDCASATITRCGVGIVNAGNAVEYLVTHG